jgi:6-phosphofructokinase 1
MAFWDDGGTVERAPGMRAPEVSLPARLFLSYNHSEQAHRVFVQKVWSHLRSQPDIEAYYYPGAPPEHQVGDFWERIMAELIQIRDEGALSLFILFAGETLGPTQLEEMNTAIDVTQNNRRLWVRLSDTPDPASERFRTNLNSVTVRSMADPGAETCARDIVTRLGRQWQPPRGIPPGYPFAFEKEVIRLYLSGQGHEWLPPEWPRVRKDPADRPNPLDPNHIGAYRAETASVTVHARFAAGEAGNGGLTLLAFPEGGPREHLRFPRPHQQNLRVGVLVSGGIAPGINAVLDAIVARHFEYMNAHNGGVAPRYKVLINGYLDGLKSLTNESRGRWKLHEGNGRDAVLANAHAGGSLLGTSRVESLLELSPEGLQEMQRLLDRVRFNKLDILYIIGGDGSMRAAHAISVEAAHHEDAHLRGLRVVGIPKTMDNDILWVWQSFGFLTAVEEANRITRALHTEATSNPRLGVIQLFGSDSGFVVSHAAIGSGVCDAALIPEVSFNLNELCQYMCNVLVRRYESGRDDTPHGLIVMAETAISSDYEDFIDSPEIALSADEREAVRRFIDDGRRVRGQTPDLLRSAALRMVARALERAVRAMGEREAYWRTFRVFTNEPRHLIRSSPPSVVDAVLAGRLGMLAVDTAMAGYTDVMVSQWLTEYVLVPLDLVVLGRKRVPQEGIFWNSVISSLEAHSGEAVTFLE